MSAVMADNSGRTCTGINTRGERELAGLFRPSKLHVIDEDKEPGGYAMNTIIIWRRCRPHLATY